MKYIYTLLIALLFAGGLQAQTCFYTATYNGSNTVTFAAPPIISGPGFSLHWDYGDGQSVIAPNPTHVYSTPGTYVACLTVYDTTATFPICTYCDSIVIGVCSFTFIQDSINANLYYFFANNTSPGSTISWSFGDGTSGTGTQTTHTYNSSGPHTVTMNEVASNGSVICSYTLVISGTGGSTCSYFLSQPNPTSSPGLYTFDALPNSPTALIYWDFGDGVTGTGNVISHSYSASGTYTACMIAVDGLDSCFYCQNITVTLNSGNCYYTSIQDSINTSLYYFFASPAYSGSTIMWDFGTGATAYGITTSYQFVNPGVYQVCMTELDSNGVILCTSCQSISVNNSPVCLFSSSTNPNNPLEVTFTAPFIAGASYTWDFGFGVTATGATVTTTFPIDGSYQVCLTVYAFGAVYCTSCQNIAVSSTAYCQASFTSVSVGLNAYFIDQSVGVFNGPGSGASYFWDFGDGNTSSLQFPQHQYSTPGVYTACLTISSALCTSTYCDSLLIDTNIINPVGCNAYFIFTQTSPYQLVGVNLSSGNNITFAWDFGDGSPIVNTPYPSHQYASTGSYQVCLTVADFLGCVDTYCDTLNVDSLGNIFYRGLSTGFVLNILSPAQLATGISDLTPVTISGIYPVPATDKIIIQLADKKSAELKYTIVSVEGKKISTGIISGVQNEINIQDLNSGIYFIEVSNEQGIKETRKFIKQ